MCGIRPEERVGSAAVCEKLGMSVLGNVIAKRRLRWFGHVERSSGWINQCHKLVVKGPARRIVITPGMELLMLNVKNGISKNLMPLTG